MQKDFMRKIYIKAIDNLSKYLGLPSIIGERSERKVENPFYQQALGQHLERVSMTLALLADKIERLEQNSRNAGLRRVNEKGGHRPNVAKSSRGPKVAPTPPMDDWDDDYEEDQDLDDEQ
ncbi:hypothetical protein GH714_010649 [Hevea brasiliensis]|uniref:Uncharacterized protein n=1 Tax=Hevea brasiliensis TaxID=3981 RepID=A0A6A6M815_HEVBR|nr:hypothetical protein GH714_010649 [Hevea brasiliensis]